MRMGVEEKRKREGNEGAGGGGEEEKKRRRVKFGWFVRVSTLKSGRRGSRFLTSGQKQKWFWGLKKEIKANKSSMAGNYHTRFTLPLSLSLFCELEKTKRKEERNRQRIRKKKERVNLVRMDPIPFSDIVELTPISFSCQPTFFFFFFNFESWIDDIFNKIRN